MTTVKNKPTILLSALDNYGGAPFDEVFDVVLPAYGGKDVLTAWEINGSTHEGMALVIWGGADISPSIYGQLSNCYTGPDKPTPKDQLEMELAYEAMDKGIPIIGICRGAQLMCALAGGKLIQHVTNHAGGYHDIVTKDGRTFSCPSVHHQMMWPWDVEHEFIAWTPKPRSTKYLGEPLPDDKEAIGQFLELPGPEPEIVWFPKVKSICIQSHPEFVPNVKHPFVQYSLELVKHYCELKT
jgi:hypothetical protein